MLIGNKLHKLDQQGTVARITTDDIPEGEYNKYCLEYPDGKQIGDVVVRLSNEEVPCHALLNGQLIHASEYRSFYNWVIANREKSATDINYEYFAKTEADYEQFLSQSVFEQTGEHYCPYFTVGEVVLTVYEVVDEHGRIGYVDMEGEADTEIESDTLVFDDTNLSNAIGVGGGWFYNGNSVEGSDKYVRIPTYPCYTNGNTKSYYFIIISSRVENDTTSIRSVSVGHTETLSAEENAYVKNSGTLQNLVLDFGVPKGKGATVSIGNVSSDRHPNVENVGTPEDAVLDFVLAKGDTGPAGGVLTLDHIKKDFPTTPVNGDVFFNTSDNKLYQYNNGWSYYRDAEEGLIYIMKDIVYHFDGKELIEFSHVIEGDGKTILKDDNGDLACVGTITKNGVLKYDWIGTLHEWENGRIEGTIPDNWVCFVIDD